MEHHSRQKTGESGEQMRGFVTFRTLPCLVLIGLGLFGFLAFAHPASARDLPNPSTDIRDYIASEHAVESKTATEIVLPSAGAYVYLKGPITISVDINDNGSESHGTVKIESGDTYVVGDEASIVTPWTATVTLVSVATPGPSTDIRDYVTKKYAVERETATEITLSFAGASVTFKGPITISVDINDNGSESIQTVNIQDTYTVEVTPRETPWTARITLASVEVTKVDVLNLVLGATGLDVTGYMNEHGFPPEVVSNAGAAAALEAINLFTKVLNDNGGGALPSVKEAANDFGTIYYLASLKDQDTNKPLFPSLQSLAIRQVLTRMTLAGVQDAKNLVATRKLLSLLIGMDMYRARADQSGTASP